MRHPTRRAASKRNKREAASPTWRGGGHTHIERERDYATVLAIPMRWWGNNTTRGWSKQQSQRTHTGDGTEVRVE